MQVKLLSNWEYSYFTNCIFLRHDLLQRILDCSTLNIVLQIWLPVCQRCLIMSLR